MAFRAPAHLNALGFAAPPAQASAAPVDSPPCLIVNPRSYGVATRGLASTAIALATKHGAHVIEAAEPAQLAAGLDQALARGTRRVIVLAGDGTIQAIADCLARRPAGLEPPLFLVLAGGRTNLTAADLGADRPVLPALESALMRRGQEAAGASEIRHRHTLVIEQPPAPPRHGFFLAAALADTFIRRCHRFRETGEGSLRRGGLGTAWCLLHAAISALGGHEDFVRPELDVEMPERGRLLGPSRLLIATTLVHDRRLLNPYADRGAGALRVTAVAEGAPGFWHSLPRLLTGRFSAAMDAGRGYLSGRCDRLTVRGLSAFTLDGQSFDTDPARPVVVRAGIRMSFLVP